MPCLWKTTPPFVKSTRSCTTFFGLPRLFAFPTGCPPKQGEKETNKKKKEGRDSFLNLFSEVYIGETLCKLVTEHIS
ncbi:hypothetical protein [Cedratvirus kamchatka]|uniref:Uncharacterized protein n=1 Tax=Cedratvirus kamchatka TaxID=2716914 RepID=A0A6G8MY85_9VIRU|nr:hypothetical protein [Cedratvirus kamchatka]